MKPILLALVLAVDLASLPKSLQVKIDNLYGSLYKPADFERAVEALTPNEKNVVISYLKGEVQEAGHDASVANVDLLVNLGDEETIDNEVQAFPSSSLGGETFLFRSSQPKVIIALAPKMFSNEPDTMIGADDAPSYRPSFEAAEANRAILATSPYFSRQVNDWAASWKFGVKPIEFRREMCKWWLANRIYIESGDYARVQPGDPRSSASSPLSSATSLVPTAFPEAVAANTTASPAASTIVLAKESSWPLILALGSVALIVVSLLAVLKAKR